MANSEDAKAVGDYVKDHSTLVSFEISLNFLHILLTQTLFVGARCCCGALQGDLYHLAM